MSLGVRHSVASVSARWGVAGCAPLAIARLGRAQRRQGLLESVRRHLGDVEVVGERAGLHMVVWLALPASAGRLVVDAAAAVEVGVDTLNPCYMERPSKLGLLLSYVNSNVKSIDLGMRRLAGAIDHIAHRRR
jgi:DNA-binding transcriptional MocR family regulator